MEGNNQLPSSDVDVRSVEQVHHRLVAGVLGAALLIVVPVRSLLCHPRRGTIRRRIR